MNDVTVNNMKVITLNESIRFRAWCIWLFSVLLFGLATLLSFSIHVAYDFIKAITQFIDYIADYLMVVLDTNTKIIKSNKEQKSIVIPRSYVASVVAIQGKIYKQTCINNVLPFVEGEKDDENEERPARVTTKLNE